MQVIRPFSHFKIKEEKFSVEIVGGLLLHGISNDFIARRGLWAEGQHKLIKPSAAQQYQYNYLPWLSDTSYKPS
jgi:hypothetical protein